MLVFLVAAWTSRQSAQYAHTTHIQVVLEKNHLVHRSPCPPTVCKPLKSNCFRSHTSSLRTLSHHCPWWSPEIFRRGVCVTSFSHFLNKQRMSDVYAWGAKKIMSVCEVVSIYSTSCILIDVTQNSVVAIIVLLYSFCSCTPHCSILGGRCVGGGEKKPWHQLNLQEETFISKTLQYQLNGCNCNNGVGDF